MSWHVKSTHSIHIGSETIITTAHFIDLKYSAFVHARVSLMIYRRKFRNVILERVKRVSLY